MEGRGIQAYLVRRAVRTSGRQVRLAVIDSEPFWIEQSGKASYLTFASKRSGLIARSVFLNSGSSRGTFRNTDLAILIDNR